MIKKIFSEKSVRILAQGCLFGQFSGDVLGSPVEFETAEEIRLRYLDGVCGLESVPRRWVKRIVPSPDALDLASRLIRDKTNGRKAVKLSHV